MERNDGPDEMKKWSVKYYKGLGTSTPTEAKQYFSAFDNHFCPFRSNSDVDGELVDMVFDKKRAADRREWILDEFDQDLSLVGILASETLFVTRISSTRR